MLGFRIQFVLLESTRHGTCMFGIPKIPREVFILNDDQGKQPPKLQLTFGMSIHFTASLQAFSPKQVPMPWKTRTGPPTSPGLLLLLSVLQGSRGRGAHALTKPSQVPGPLPTVTATSHGICKNTVRATQNHTQNAKSNYLIALIRALVRSMEHNYILALKRVKKKKGFILMF